MVKRRTLWIAPTILAMLGLLGFCSIDWLKVEQMRAKPNTLRSRVLAYERELQNINPWPSRDQIDDHITNLMGEYFKVGVSEEECVKILKANELAVDERYFDVPDVRHLPRRVFFKPSLVSRIEIPTGHLLMTLEYRLVFNFVDGQLDSFEGVRVGTGP